jgi:hypothetical protein
MLLRLGSGQAPMLEKIGCKFRKPQLPLGKMFVGFRGWAADQSSFTSIFNIPCSLFDIPVRPLPLSRFRRRRQSVERKNGMSNKEQGMSNIEVKTGRFTSPCPSLG